MAEQIDHPAHYGGADNPYEAIKVIEAWGLGFCLGNAVKYISRAGRKGRGKLVEDLKKARWYLDREISNLEKRHAQNAPLAMIEAQRILRAWRRFTCFLMLFLVVTFASAGINLIANSAQKCDKALGTYANAGD